MCWVNPTYCFEQRAVLLVRLAELSNQARMHRATADLLAQIDFKMLKTAMMHLHHRLITVRWLNDSTCEVEETHRALAHKRWGVCRLRSSFRD